MSKEATFLFLLVCTISFALIATPLANIAIHLIYNLAAHL